jgi:AAA+ superfamily predicted ATPase
VFVATTNHVTGVDVAFLSRADLVEEVRLPGAEAIALILQDTLAELVPADRIDGPALHALATECVRRCMDARQVRKLVLRAVCASQELALAPERLTLADVSEALRADRP